ncbi:MAG: diguanylate cyclase [Paraglaciecola sp.]|nr:diguanylate cyclase [Paraglaciecola sp.]NCT46651.1 diguanylate cyclase [Paraglaciecola sp.]
MHSPWQITIRRHWLWVLFVLCAVLIAAAYISMQSMARPKDTIVSQIEHFSDASAKVTLSDILSMPDGQWRDADQEVAINSPYDVVHWYRFTLPATTGGHPLLEIDYPLLDYIDLWFVSEQTVIRHIQTGDKLAFGQRPIANENFLFPVPARTNAITVYVRVQTKGLLHFSVNIWQHDQYIDFNAQHSLFMGMFFGFLLAMAASNFFFFITTKASSFAIYCSYVLLLGLSLATIHGYAFRYLWPDFPSVQQYALPVLLNLSMAFALIFCDRLLNVKDFSQKLCRGLRGLALVYLLSAMLCLILPLSWFIPIFLMALVVSGTLIYVVAIWLWSKGVSLAGVFTLAWSVLFFSGVIVAFHNLNILHTTLPNDYLLVLGAAMEILLLALVVAINHSQQGQALLNAQAQLLKQAMQDKQNQQDLLNLQESAQEDLEYKVQERTLELEIALRELSEINRELQEKNTLDALTGIRNRSYFDKKYVAEIRRSRRERTPLSIVMLDIDHFKKINDLHGHLAGDECIKAVASLLKQALKRPSDDLCRYGGEEFVLILPNTDLAGAMALVEQARMSISAYRVVADNTEINMTISAGIATAITDIAMADDALLALADQQLYLAKSSGRDNTQGAYLDQSSPQQE